MSRFQELALAMAKNSIDKLDKQIKDNKLATELENQPLEAQKTQTQLVENEIKYEQRVEKLKRDIAKQAAKAEQQLAQGPVAIGGNLVDNFAPPVEQEAEGLPVLQEMNQGLPA